MNKLEKDKIGIISERFNNFTDGLLRRIELSYNEDGSRTITASIATRDREERFNDGWVTITIQLKNVSEFYVHEEPKVTSQVFSQGIHICWFDDVVGVDFGWLIDSPENIDELKSSHFFACGSSLHWDVGPY